MQAEMLEIPRFTELGFIMNHFCVFLLLLMNLIDELLHPQNSGPSRAHPRPQTGAAVHLAAPAWLASNFICKWVFSVALHGVLVLQPGPGWGATVCGTLTFLHSLQADALFQTGFSG